MADSTRARSGAKAPRSSSPLVAAFNDKAATAIANEVVARRTTPKLHPAKSKTKASAKRRPAFSLWLHSGTGQWAKKIKGRMFYFGTDKDKALEKYLHDKPHIEAGRRPPPIGEQQVTIKQLGDTFLTHKKHQVKLGEMTQRSFEDYQASCQRFADFIGKHTPVDTIRPDELLRYRQHLAKTCGPHALGNQVQRVRVLLRFAFENDLIDRPVKFGEFKRPGKKALRRQRTANGPRLFTPAELRRILEAADCQMKAMVLLGINCGFGNADCGTLPMEAIDLVEGWIDYPRPKTGIARRSPLWPETVEALRDVLDERKAPKLQSDVLFVTKYGSPWYIDGATWNPVSAEFGKLLDGIDGEAVKQAKVEAKEARRKYTAPAKLRRPGLTFYSLRHCFQTIADELGDYIATRRIMGHADPSIGDTYRERFPDERLRRVVNHVRSWLYPRPFVGSAQKSDGAL